MSNRQITLSLERDSNKVHPFIFGKNGKLIKLKSARDKLNAFSTNIVKILDELDTNEKKACVLQEVLKNSKLRGAIETISVENAREENIIRFLEKLYEKANKRGQISDEKKMLWK